MKFLSLVFHFFDFIGVWFSFVIRFVRLHCLPLELSSLRVAHCYLNYPWKILEPFYIFSKLPQTELRINYSFQMLELNTEVMVSNSQNC